MDAADHDAASADAASADAALLNKSLQFHLVATLAIRQALLSSLSHSRLSHNRSFLAVLQLLQEAERLVRLSSIAALLRSTLRHSVAEAERLLLSSLAVQELDSPLGLLKLTQQRN